MELENETGKQVERPLETPLGNVMINTGSDKEAICFKDADGSSCWLTNDGSSIIRIETDRD